MAVYGEVNVVDPVKTVDIALTENEALAGEVIERLGKCIGLTDGLAQQGPPVCENKAPSPLQSDVPLVRRIEGISRRLDEAIAVIGRLEGRLSLLG